MMHCEILTLFPDLITCVTEQSILKRAQEKGLVRIRVRNIRDFTSDRQRVVDDSPYGGGSGMVMKAAPILQAVEAVRSEVQDTRLILPSPQGVSFGQGLAEEFSKEPRTLVFVCGHYEGIDERVRCGLPCQEVSIGDYVLTGGELAALVMIDVAARLIPGVLGHPESAQQDSFATPLLDYPHYTRPATYRGMSVPQVLLSGDHEAIRIWRRKEALRSTYVKRPDLLPKLSLTDEDRRLLMEIQSEYEFAVTAQSKEG